MFSFEWSYLHREIYNLVYVFAWTMSCSLLQLQFAVSDMSSHKTIDVVFSIWIYFIHLFIFLLLQCISWMCKDLTSISNDSFLSCFLFFFFPNFRHCCNKHSLILLCIHLNNSLEQMETGTDIQKWIAGRKAWTFHKDRSCQIPTP